MQLQTPAGSTFQKSAVGQKHQIFLGVVVWLYFFLAVSFSTSPTCWSVLKGRCVARSLESLGSQPTSTSSSGNTMAFLGLQWGNEQVWNAHLRAVVDAAATTCEKKTSFWSLNAATIRGVNSLDARTSDQYFIELLKLGNVIVVFAIEILWLLSHKPLSKLCSAGETSRGPWWGKNQFSSIFPLCTRKHWRTKGHSVGEMGWQLQCSCTHAPKKLRQMVSPNLFFSFQVKSQQRRRLKPMTNTWPHSWTLALSKYSTPAKSNWFNLQRTASSKRPHQHGRPGQLSARSPRILHL